jgi:hypothetical protein
MPRQGSDIDLQKLVKEGTEALSNAVQLYTKELVSCL